MSISVAEIVTALNRTFPRGIAGLIFDCDGVMVDSRDVNIGYYSLLLKEVGRPPVSEEQAKYVQMSTAKEALEYLFTHEELKLLPAIAEKNPYRTVALPLLSPEPGLTELLRWLKQEGLRLGIHTNRGTGMWDLLHQFDLEGVFDPVMTADNTSPKPSPEGVFRILEQWKVSPDMVAFVGDSPTDVAAARGGGVPLLAYGNPALDAAVHVSSFSELREALESIPLRPGRDAAKSHT